MPERKETAPLVAVIVPVYNDEKYLQICLDSILNQTASFWEDWLVDDCSTDTSPDIIQKYCEKDARFHSLHNDVNSSAWVSRAKGILAVSPSVKYIMFADADDSLELYAVEKAYDLMEKDPVDILHFGTSVKYLAENTPENIKKYSDYLQPELSKLTGRDVFDSFISRDFEGHLWNKLFRANLLQDVIQELGADRILPKAQDKALYWAACWQKEDLTYRGVADKLYIYNYGLGVEGSRDHLTLDQFRQYLSQAWTEDTIAEVMAKHPEESEKYTEIIEKSRSNLINHTARAYARLHSADKVAGMDLIADYWRDPLDTARFVSALAAHTWGSQIELANTVTGSQLFKIKTKDIALRVIGTYYHRMDNGGIQRVIAQLMPIWHQMGYEVVLFTDYEGSENDYEIPDYVTRVAIGHSFSRSRRGKYAKRGINFAKLLMEYNVDCMVYHSYFSDVLLYDMCVCKSLNIPFLIYEHNVFSRFARYSDTKFSTIPIFARVADGVICLDDVSAVWWKHFNPNVHVVLNPLTFDLSKTIPSERNNHTILFLCRLEEEAKHPHDAITIIRELVKRLPDVKMYIVGSGSSRRYVKRLHDRIIKLNLENNIIMTGFTKDVESYYLESSLFLSCSSHEGFMLTLGESLSHNIPVVMYDLPYLPLVQNNPGIFSVRQRDIDMAVDAIYRLFTNQALLLEAGDAGREFLAKMYSIDLSSQWNQIFESLYCVHKDLAFETKVMCDILIRDYYDGAMQAKAQVDDKSEKELKRVKSSLSFRIGRAITFVPRKIRDKLKRILPKRVKDFLKKIIKRGVSR